MLRHPGPSSFPAPARPRPGIRFRGYERPARRAAARA
jgi:hypothetical protein